MKSYKPKEIVALLLARGFEFARAKGSHQIYINHQSGNAQWFYACQGLETLHGILKQAGIDPGELN